MNLRVEIGVNGAKREYKFGEVTEITIGREDDNLISPIVDSISRHHAKIYFKDGAWYVQDLDSTNGSFKGEERLTAEPVKIADGDKFRFGKVETVFELLGAPSATVVKELPKPAEEIVVPTCTQQAAPVTAAVPPPKVPVITPAAEVAELTPVDDIPELKPEELTPVEPAAPAKPPAAPAAKPASPLSPIAPAKPIMKKPVLGGGLKAGLKLPPKPGFAAGLKLPPKPGIGGLKPGLKLPGKPA